MAHDIFAGESSSRGQLMQWSQKPDLNVGNPLMDLSDWHLKKYERLVARYQK
jgi:hypothetical protein